MRSKWMIAFLSLAVGLAAPRAGAAPMAMHAEGSVSGLNTTTNAGYGFGGGVGFTLTPILSVGLDVSGQKYSIEMGAKVPEDILLGGGNDYLTTALIAARLQEPNAHGARFFVEAGAGGARLSHTAEYWATMNAQPPPRFVVPSRTTDMPATMVGAGVQTRPILGGLRLGLSARYQWMWGPDGEVGEKRLGLGVAI